MARKVKKLFDDTGTEIRELGYYSTPIEVANFIQDRLIQINPSISRVLDPAVGKEELIKKFLKRGIKVDGFDVYNHLKNYQCKFINQNFLEYCMNNIDQNLLIKNELDYDAIIMNPPYNCHEINYIKDNKKRLCSYFPETKVLNMYSMFMDVVITHSKAETLIGMIVSDSFMTSKMHSKLRQKIISNCKIYNLILCPNNLFWKQKADVRTCILILKKTTKNKDNYKIDTLSREISLDSFYLKLKQKSFESEVKNNFILDFKKDNREWLIDVPKECIQLFKNKRLGDLFPCVTGISTGNDSKYLSKTCSKEYCHPFYKNPGSQKFKCEPNNFLITDYLNIDKKVKNFMVRNKQFIGKEGITCSSMGVAFSACYLPPNSTFGVNPNIFPDQQSIYWLLSYLNSELVTFLIRSSLIRTNMITSGYLARLPIIFFEQSIKDQLTELAKTLIKNDKKSNKEIAKINQLVFNSANLSNQTIEHIIAFNKNLVRKV